MKKFITVILFATVFCFSCEDSKLFKNEMDSQSMLKVESTNTEIAEKKYGKLVYENKIVKDEKTGSYISLKFAGQSKNVLSDFFESNEIVFDALNKTEAAIIKKDKLENKNRLSLSKVNDGNNANNNDDVFSNDNVFFDVVKLKLLSEDVGYRFYIKPKKIGDKKAKVQVSWCQQTSLEWCESLTIYTVKNTYTYSALYKTAGVYSHQRGLFWNGSGAVIGVIRDDGTQWVLDIDGPKFTRVGGNGDFNNIVNYVEWFDSESQSSVTAN